MAKAPQAEQHKLLELQGYDSRIVKLTRRATEIKSNPQLTAARRNAAEAATALAEVDAELATVRKDLAASEHEVEQVQAHMAKDQKQLDSGFGDSKQLMGLQHELETLGKRKSDLEDAELELMEALEEVGTRREEAARVSADAAAALEALERAQAGELAGLEREKAVLATQRAEFAATVEPGLLALYEKRLAQRGIGAARLFHGTSEGSGMQLAAGDLAEIKAAAEDDVVFCPDSGCILVRSAEWGA